MIHLHLPRRVIFLVLACLTSSILTSGILPAQDVNDEGLWFAYFENGKVSDLGFEADDRLKFWFDAHLRFFDDTEGFGQSIIRPGLGWSLSDQSAIWAGYGWIRSSPANSEDIDEHRLWQQWTTAPVIGKSKTLFRTRLEQRWLETGDDVGLRLRQLMRMQRPFKHTDDFYFVAWDELFFNLNDVDWGAEEGFGQNRAFVGVGMRPKKLGDGRVEIGYLLQSINAPGPDNRSNHILSVNFFF